MLYVVSNQMNILFYENMRNDFAKSFLVLVAFTSSHQGNRSIISTCYLFILRVV